MFSILAFVTSAFAGTITDTGGCPAGDWYRYDCGNGITLTCGNVSGCCGIESVGKACSSRMVVNDDLLDYPVMTPRGADLDRDLDLVCDTTTTS